MIPFRSRLRDWTQALALVLAVALGIAPSLPVRAAPALQTLVTNGPAAQRLNVVFFSEGYTSGELGQFLADATNALAALLGKEPYSEYRSYLDGFAIVVASAQSGSDHPKNNVLKDTYFNSTYDLAGDYVITIPENANGVGKVNALLQQFIPEFQTNRDLTVLLVNDPIRGGSGGPRIITSKDATWEEILVHESGHTLGRLGDEYEYEVPGFEPPAIEFPNITTNTQRALIKWNAWIEPSTPVPTPWKESVRYWDLVGLFEGANYSSTGWYRPKYDCLMRTISSVSIFCEVCQEALVLAIYDRVRPGENFLPAVTNLTLTPTQSLAFSVTTLQPEARTVRIQWSTNGTSVPGATNAAFVLTGSALGNGMHTVQVHIRDHSAKVRSDPAGRLSQVRTWQVQRIGLHLEAPQALAGGECYVRVTGRATREVVLEGSTNLADWKPLRTNWLTAGEWRFTNNCSSNHWFFRAVTTP